MKKLALFAMLLGSTFVFGCETKPAEKPKDTPAAEAPKEGDAKPADEAAKPADEAAKPADEAPK